MDKPPFQLDGADVIQYATSKQGEYYTLQGTEPPVKIAAMAICRYKDGDRFYLFKCDSNWEVFGDWDCESIAEGMEIAAQHANGERLRWIFK
jgi:hypothetical protein